MSSLNITYSGFCSVTLIFHHFLSKIGFLDDAFLSEYLFSSQHHYVFRFEFSWFTYYVIHLELLVSLFPADGIAELSSVQCIIHVTKNPTAWDCFLSFVFFCVLKAENTIPFVYNVPPSPPLASGKLQVSEVKVFFSSTRFFKTSSYHGVPPVLLTSIAQLPCGCNCEASFEFIPRSIARDQLQCPPPVLPCSFLLWPWVQRSVRIWHSLWKFNTRVAGHKRNVAGDNSR